MNIGFDAKRLFRNFTGLGNYSRFIVSALTSQFPDHRYILFTPPFNPHPETHPILSDQSVQVVQPSGLWRLSGPLWRTMGMTLTAEVRHLNVFHGLSHELPMGLPSHIPKVVTVHDLIFYRYPGLYNPIDVSIYKAKIRSACRRADVVVAISRQTADDAVAFLKVPPSRVRVVYQGCHPQFSHRISPDDISRVRQKYDLPSAYLLHVGTVERRKNIMVAVEALRMLPESLRLPLVIVGRWTPYADDVMDKARQLDISRYVLMRHEVTFSDLPAIYQGALVFLYPSVFEGFGIPIIEAISSGVPVITSTGSCFSEAGGPHTRYVSPRDAAAWRDEIQMLVENESLRREIAQQAMTHVEQFQPSRIASDLMKIYSSL
jgi:glycosyltransferase involved in cell wall biosynthesis